jgi:hypothetical protein
LLLAAIVICFEHLTMVRPFLSPSLRINHVIATRIPRIAPIVGEKLLSIRGGALDHRPPCLHTLFQTRYVTTTSRISTNDGHSIISTKSPEFQTFLEQHETVSLSFITDIEGDKAYLDRYVETSKVLKFIDRTPTPLFSFFRNSNNNSSQLPYPFPYDRCIDFMDDNSILLFGGDLWDKGGFDLYVARQLIDLKRRYPHRVFWVLGNRDINKLRMMQELGLPPLEDDDQVQVPFHPGLTWFKGSGRVGDPKGELPSMIPGERLAWMLGSTMGSPDAFEHRRQELAWEAKFVNNVPLSDINISDDDVVRSYQESCHPCGELGLFLSNGFLSAQIGPVLFVHGSLPLTPEVMELAKKASKSVWDDLYWAMPWISENKSAPNDTNVTTINEWLDALNQFCHDNIVKWKRSIAELEVTREQCRQNGKDYYKSQDKKSSKKSIWAYCGGYGNGPPYSDLIQYGMGMLASGKKNPTVVYNSFTPEGMPSSFLPAEKQQDQVEADVASCTREFFDRGSIQLVCSGHKPQGDSPSPIRIDDTAWVICADTSYSGDTVWWQGSNADSELMSDGAASSPESTGRSNLGRGNSLSFRGDVAVSEVLISLSNHGKNLDSVQYHGVLSDGMEYESVNLLNAASNTTLGRVAPDHMVPAPSDSPHQGRWWTKNIFSDGSRLFYAGEGFNVWNYFVSEK